MKKVLLLLSLVGGYIYANTPLSCENMNEETFKKILLDYKNSINLEHFKNPNTDFIEEDKQYIKQIGYSTKEIKKCQYILDLNKYGIDSQKRYRALYNLNDMSLTAKEQELYNFRISESQKKYKSLISASIVSFTTSKPFSTFSSIFFTILFFSLIFAIIHLLILFQFFYFLLKYFVLG